MIAILKDLKRGCNDNAYTYLFIEVNEVFFGFGAVHYTGINDIVGYVSNLIYNISYLKNYFADKQTAQIKLIQGQKEVIKTIKIVKQ